MSDGDNDATLDHRGTPRAGHGQGSTPNPRPTLGAAPWERFSETPPEHNVHRGQAEPPLIEPVEPEAGKTETGGCHSDGGLTVADLIAKIGAPIRGRHGHHHVAPDTELPEGAPDLPGDPQPTQVISPPAYSLDFVSEFPDLETANDPNGDESESDRIEEPTASRRLRGLAG